MSILKMTRRMLLGAVLLLAAVGVRAQILNITPAFPSPDDTVTIVYDATQGNAALTNTAPVYAHAGLITDKSTTLTDWKYVQGSWGTADPKVLMTNLGNNKHQLKYHIRSFYGVPTSDTVKSLAFVFRNASGSVVGRATDGSDIYYPIYNANSGLLGVFFAPSEQAVAVNAGATIPVYAASSQTGTLRLFDNGVQVFQTTGKSLNYNLMVAASGNHTVVFEANASGAVVRDTFRYVVNPTPTSAALPANVELGLNRIDSTTAIFALYAPFKNNVYLVGDFNNWQPNVNYHLNRTPDGKTWWIQVNGLKANQPHFYQYWVDNTIRIADPYSELVLDPSADKGINAATYPNLPPYPAGASGFVTLFETTKKPYNWQHTNYQRPLQSEMVVYELLVRDFIAAHNYQTLKDTLDYLQRLGVNAIELMPVNEFENNESWGYNPSFHGALDKYYGSPEAFKAFVDECHARGMAVILDAVFNHAFGQNPLVQLYWDGANNQPAANSPYFYPTAMHPFNVGFDFNHDSEATQYYTRKICRYWVNEYQIDGFRFDLSKGFTGNAQCADKSDVGCWGNYHADRVATWKRIADEVWANNPATYVILEHFADNAEEKELAEYKQGMLFWGNLNHNYNEATMGWLPQSNFEWGIYTKRGWSKPHVVTYMESHDEERLMYKNSLYGNVNGAYSTKNSATALQRMELGAALFLTIPGPKMIWQFGEIGYDVSINFNCRVCNKPIRWNYFTEAGRRRLYDVYSALNRLRNQHRLFHTDNFSYALAGGVKTVHLYSDTMNAVVLGNFDVTAQTAVINFPHTGIWYDYIIGSTLNVTAAAASLPLNAGEYHIFTDKNIGNIGIAAVATYEPAANVFGMKAFPNPVVDGDLLQLSFESPRTERTFLLVNNHLGQEMQTIAVGELAKGSHQFEINVSDLSAGQYFITVVQGDAHATLPFAVVR